MTLCNHYCRFMQGSVPRIITGHDLNVGPHDTLARSFTVGMHVPVV